MPPKWDGGAWFRRGEDVEAADRAEAERACHEAIELAADHEPAHINLGAIGAAPGV